MITKSIIGVILIVLSSINDHIMDKLIKKRKERENENKKRIRK